MCIITRKNKLEIKTATEDMVVYKLVVYDQGNLYTYFMEIPVCLGETYDRDDFVEKWEEIHIGPRKRYAIGEGAFHSAVRKEDLEKDRDNRNWTYRVFELDTRIDIAKCIIPKGSRYVEGRTYQCFNKECLAIASEKIKYIEIV